MQLTHRENEILRVDAWFMIPSFFPYLHWGKQEFCSKLSRKRMLAGLVLIKYGLLASQTHTEQDEKSAHLVSWEQTHKMNVTHFSNNRHLWSSKKNFWSKETTDFIIQIRNSSRLPRQRSTDQNARCKEERKEFRFNLQNTEIIAGELVCWGVKLKCFLPAQLSMPRNTCDEIPH